MLPIVVRKARGSSMTSICWSQSPRAAGAIGPGSDSVDERGGTEERHLRVCLHQYCRGFPTEQRGIAHKLQSVAKTMQAADHHAFSRKRLPIPEPVGIGPASRRDGIAFPPRLFEASHEHPAIPPARRAFVRRVAGTLRTMQKLQPFGNVSFRKCILRTPILAFPRESQSQYPAPLDLANVALTTIGDPDCQRVADLFMSQPPGYTQCACGNSGMQKVCCRIVVHLRKVRLVLLKCRSIS
jgi:hypothetical protein